MFRQEIMLREFFSINFLFFFLNFIIIYIYWSTTLSLNRPSRLSHARKTFSQFNFKVEVSKKLSFFPINFQPWIFLYLSAKLSLYWLSRLGHVDATLTWFNYKLGIGKKLNYDILKLTHRAKFNKNTI